jgi:hypothetical protein
MKEIYCEACSRIVVSVKIKREVDCMGEAGMLSRVDAKKSMKPMIHRKKGQIVLRNNISHVVIIQFTRNRK